MTLQNKTKETQGATRRNGSPNNLFTRAICKGETVSYTATLSMHKRLKFLAPLEVALVCLSRERVVPCGPSPSTGAQNHTVQDCRPS
jgi:hypothetical protein